MTIFGLGLWKQLVCATARLNLTVAQSLGVGSCSQQEHMRRSFLRKVDSSGGCLQRVPRGPGQGNSGLGRGQSPSGAGTPLQWLSLHPA